MLVEAGLGDHHCARQLVNELEADQSGPVPVVARGADEGEEN